MEQILEQLLVTLAHMTLEAILNYLQSIVF